MQTKEELLVLQKKLFDFSKRNPFVNCRLNKLWFERNPLESTLKKIHAKATLFEREYGLETTLRVHYFLVWTPPNKSLGTENRMISPLFFEPCKILVRQKIKKEYEILHEKENLLTNPIIDHYFEVFYGYKLGEITEDTTEEIDRFKAFFKTTNTAEIPLLHSFDALADESWAIIKTTAIGNFNYKKSTLGADYKQIESAPNESLNRLFQNGLPHKVKNEKPLLITAVDQSQRRALTQAFNTDVTIHGHRAPENLTSYQP